MYLPPYAADQLATVRQREKLARAGQQLRGRQPAAPATASRGAQWAERRMRRAVRRTVQPRTQRQRGPGRRGAGGGRPTVV